MTTLFALARLTTPSSNWREIEERPGDAVTKASSDDVRLSEFSWFMAR